MRRNVTLEPFYWFRQIFLVSAMPPPDRLPRPHQTPTFPSAIKIASTPPNNIPTPSPSPIPP